MEALELALDGARTEPFLRDQQRLTDLRLFLKSAAAAASSAGVPGFLRTVVDRHAQVQRGKFDKGRPKLPWVEFKDAAFQLTLARVGELSYEPTRLEDIGAHAYRVDSADELLRAAKRVQS